MLTRYGIVGDVSTRVAVAANPNTDTAALVWLACDAASGVAAHDGSQPELSSAGRYPVSPATKIWLCARWLRNARGGLVAKSPRWLATTTGGRFSPRRGTPDARPMCWTVSSTRTGPTPPRFVSPRQRTPTVAPTLSPGSWRTPTPRCAPPLPATRLVGSGGCDASGGTVPGAYQAEVATNPTLPIDVITADIAEQILSIDHQVLRAVAQRPDCGSDILARLAEHPDETVRAAASHNPNLRTADINERDPSWEMRAELASRVDCPQDVLSRLADDSDAAVCQAVAANPNTHMMTLRRMLQQPDPTITDEAVLTLSRKFRRRC